MALLTWMFLAFFLAATIVRLCILVDAPARSRPKKRTKTALDELHEVAGIMRASRGEWSRMNRDAMDDWEHRFDPHFARAAGIAHKRPTRVQTEYMAPPQTLAQAYSNPNSPHFNGVPLPGSFYARYPNSEAPYLAPENESIICASTKYLQYPHIRRYCQSWEGAYASKRRRV